MLSSKLSVGIHILAALAMEPDEALTSGWIALSVNTNPVVIRRLLGLLREAGFVDSKKGVGGGWVLKLDPGRITFLDVLRALEPHNEVFALHRGRINSLCTLSRNIQGALTEVYADAYDAMAAQLARSTLAGFVATLRDRIESSPPIPIPTTTSKA